MSFRRATENNALIPAVVEAVNMYPDCLCFPVKGEGARGRRLVVPKGTADILGEKRERFSTKQFPLWAGRPDGPLSFKPEGDWFSIGRAFAIECKATHRPTCICKSCKAQRLWRIEWEKRGGLYILARSPQEAIDGLMGRRAA